MTEKCTVSTTCALRMIYYSLMVRAGVGAVVGCLIILVCACGCVVGLVVVADGGSVGGLKEVVLVL